MSAEPAAIPVRPVALVTGASSGIGRAFAVHFLRSGHDVFAVGRDEAALASLAAVAPPGGATVTACVSDLSTPEGVRAVAEMCPEPDVVVANAGYTIAGRAGTAGWDDLQNLSYLTGAGVAQLLESLVPGMVRRGTGDILIVSSIASLVRMPGSAVYAASKSYATSYGRSLNRELRGRGVRVCVLCPGYVRTPLHERSGVGHLVRQVPGWMWVAPDAVVAAGLRGLRRGREVVVPGLVYRAALPFLNLSVAQRTWATMTRRNGRLRPRGPASP
jgi:short-subunit dehydrogenase